MQFPLPVKKNVNAEQYSKHDIDTARDFSKKLYQEFGEFLKAVVLFGSSARQAEKKHGDIDVLIIVDDVTLRMSQELVEAYRIIVQRLIATTSNKLHVMSLKLTTFWEYVRAGDPVAINILRDGVSLIDTGFFDPLQALLRQGRIRPTEESITVYFNRAPRTLHNSRWHLLQATVDLYWAVIDAAHAALMKIGEVPPSPEHVADMLEDKLVKRHMLEKHYAATMKHFYGLMKMIMYREIKEIKGEEFESYFREAQQFVERMQKFIEAKTY